MRWAVTVFATGFGTAAGSVLPVLAFRLSVPTGSATRDACPRCDTPMHAGVRGWLNTESRCRRCRVQIAGQGWRYPAAAGAGCGLLAWRLPTTTATDLLLLAAWMTFAIAGTLLAAVDLRVHRLPTPVLTYALIVVGVLIGAASVAAGDLAILRNAVAAGAVVGASYLALALLLPGRLGMGDIRLAALASVLLGTQGWDTVILGAILPYVSAAPIVAVQILRGGVQRHSQLPFGPYLIIGALASVLLSG